MLSVVLGGAGEAGVVWFQMWGADWDDIVNPPPTFTDNGNDA